MLIKKLLIIIFLASIVVVALLHVIDAQNVTYPPPFPFQRSFEIEAGKKTTIKLYFIDTTKSFVLFDNILSQDQTVTFCSQPGFWEYRMENDSDLVLPFPATVKSGIYFVRYTTPDTTFISKQVYMH